MLSSMSVFMSLFLYTAPDQTPHQFLNITVSRTHDNHGLVVQWYPTHGPQPGTTFSYYQVQYRMTVEQREEEGEGEGEVVQVDAIQNWVFVDDLENAQGYEVSVIDVAE